MVWLSGERLYGDRYIIERQLGQGGAGITYLAKDKKGNPVVIKTLKDEILTDPDRAAFLAKYQHDFRDEALRLALCRHPHIVRIDNAFLEGQLPCMVMEYVEGENLWQRVNQLGILSEAEALLYIRQIGEALTVIHDKGLLHRDVKPPNIMVREGKLEAVLIDFGIAREFIPDVTLTQPLAVSNGFAPIEQYAERARRGEYTDVYALAATLYYLLTATVPPPAFVRAARVDLEPPQQLNPGISSRVNQAILNGMAFDPEDRPQSVLDWLDLFEFEGFDYIVQTPNFASLHLHEQPQATTLPPETPVETLLETSKHPRTRRVLWVDDYPPNIVYEVAKLRDSGVEVIQALSTDQAMQILLDTLPFDAVISDMGRREQSEYRPKASVSLLKAMRSAGISLPVFVYTCGRPITRAKEEVLAAGAKGITNSAVELFALLKEYITPLPNTADDLSSEVGIDYSTLRDLLARGKWLEADEETAALMLKIADREPEGWLECEDLENFPGQDLGTINRLWVKYSNGRFGFSVQKRIYEECGKDYITFGDRLGWRVEGNWLWWNNLTFTPDAPLGHLPSWRVGGSGGVWGCFVTGGGFVLSRPDL